MSAAELRKAAALMRERAEAATEGPWRVCAEGSEGSRIAPDREDKRERTRFIGILNGRVQPEDGHNARHIASWHPAVALAVARWLEAESHQPETDIGDGITVGGPSMEAEYVARTYLGES